jgi:hypothetical protein
VADDDINAAIRCGQHLDTAIKHCGPHVGIPGTAMYLSVLCSIVWYCRLTMQWSLLLIV